MPSSTKGRKALEGVFKMGNQTLLTADARPNKLRGLEFLKSNFTEKKRALRRKKRSKGVAIGEF